MDAESPPPANAPEEAPPKKGRRSRQPRAGRIGLTLSLKLSLLYALFFFLTSMGLFAGAYYFIHGLVQKGEREVIFSRIQEYRAWYAEGGLAALKKRFYGTRDITRDIYFVRVTGPGNNALFVSIPQGAGTFDLSRLNRADAPKKSAWYDIFTGGEEDQWTVASAPLGRSLTLQVGKSSTEAWEVLRHLRRVFLIFIAPVFLLGVLGGFFLTFRTMGPLRHLIKAVRDILATGRFSTRVPGRAERGELGQLVSLFNQMLEKNEALIRAMHESLDNVAHDLRTPMARLRGVAEMALAHPDDHGAALEALSDCLEESERINVMLTTLMDVAEAETGVMRLEKEPVDVTGLVLAVADLYEILAEERSIRIETRLPDALSVPADPARLQQVLANLVDNAVKYSRDGQTVTLSARIEDDRAVIEVADQGIGIRPEDTDKIWERLYRGDRSRSRRGLGLGLSLVRAIVKAHGGEVSVASQPDEGSTFTVRLPLPGSRP